MKESALRTTDVIYIITNKQGQIEYANVENQLACVWQYENTIFGHLKYKFPYVIASTIFT